MHRHTVFVFDGFSGIPPAHRVYENLSFRRMPPDGFAASLPRACYSMPIRGQHKKQIMEVVPTVRTNDCRKYA